jgi:hypothetical protein
VGAAVVDHGGPVAVHPGSVVRLRGGDLKRGRLSGRLAIRRHRLEIVAPLSAELVAAFGHDRADLAAGRQRR